MKDLPTREVLTEAFWQQFTAITGVPAERVDPESITLVSDPDGFRIEFEVRPVKITLEMVERLLNAGRS